MEIYNKLSSVYDKFYDRNIQNFKDKLESIWKGDAWFVDFYPSFGTKPNEKCDLLFYGQAVNGWTAGFDVFEDVAADKIFHSILSSNRYFSKLNHTPLDWVNVKWSNSTYKEVTKDAEAGLFYSDEGSYRTFRSFFWNVVYKLTSDFYGFDRSGWGWSRKAVWSNLYKIAEDGANPNYFLREQQLESSAELIKREIEELNPKFCIILTNLEWWEPFSRILGTINIKYKARFRNILSYEQLYDTKFIITTRPRLGNGEMHVSELLKLIG